MKSLYLILAATAVTVTCEPQNSHNDIIWYPVDDEEGVFISTIGEKYRTPKNSKWRSHRRARYSGVDPSWSFDPSKNQDPSFFHNINERRPLITIPSIPKLPPAFQNQELLFNRPYKRPQYQENQNDNFQDILKEVFDNNKQFPLSENTDRRPGIINEWDGNSKSEKANQWNRPIMAHSWVNPPGYSDSVNRLPWQPLSTSDQGSRVPNFKPTESEWVTQVNTNKPSKRPAISIKPNNQSDKLIFPDEDMTTTSPNLIPMDPTTRSSCEMLCPVTPEFNPVCGSDGVTYSNAGRLKCAQMCGKNVKLSHHRNCGRTPFVTPLVSKNSRQRKHQTKFSGFW